VIIIVAGNGMKGRDHDLADFSEGMSDLRPHTWKLAESTDPKPKDQASIFGSTERIRQ
jgi:hypothetical protein